MIGQALVRPERHCDFLSKLHVLARMIREREGELVFFGPWSCASDNPVSSKFDIRLGMRATSMTGLIAHRFRLR
jgi:hypothetical protein